MNRIIPFCFILFFYSGAGGQDLLYARRIVDTLCRPSMYGRGYVNRGDSVAAALIAGEMIKMGLTPLYDDYFDTFRFPVNLFPGELMVRAGKKKLGPGKDYLIGPSSPAITGKFPVVEIHKDHLSDTQVLRKFLSKTKDKIILIDLPKLRSLHDSIPAYIHNLVLFLQEQSLFKPAGVVIADNKKLSWSTATFTSRIPVIQIHSGIAGKIKKMEIRIEQKWVENQPSKNVAGILRPGVYIDSIIIVTAHYDHLGMMGKNTYFPGANDNASGVALLLDLARNLSARRDTLRYPVVFVAFGGEEAGLKGSLHFIHDPVIALSKIKFLINLDLAGTGEDGITVVNATEFPEEFQLLNSINNREHWMPEIKSRGPACNSDHCGFYQKGVPCFYMYTLGGSQAYHDIYDLPEKLSLAGYEGYFRLLEEFIIHLANGRP